MEAIVWKKKPFSLRTGKQLEQTLNKKRSAVLVCKKALADLSKHNFAQEIALERI